MANIIDSVLLDQAMLHGLVLTAPPRSLKTHIELSDGVKSIKSQWLGYIFCVTSCESHSKSPDSLKDATIVWLCSSAVPSLSMIDPEKQMDFKFQLSFNMDIMTFMSEM